MPLDLERFFEGTKHSPISAHHDAIKSALATHVKKHGRSNEWDQALRDCCIEPTSDFNFDSDTIRVGRKNNSLDFEDSLKALSPWRKGPFELHGVSIDTEWRSDWKWRRITPHLGNLMGKLVLDIGCGNGYHLFRMFGAGAKIALGVDPTLIFNYQFQLVQQMVINTDVYLLPLRGEQLPPFSCFDTVFSLGVLYHRRSPLDHLSELMSFMYPGGELILETLTIEGDEQAVLLPEDRYAKMANVFFIPSTDFLERMLARVGFVNVRTVDVNTTSIEEQHATEWMTFQSLDDFLDPADISKTIEGYPAPRRAILMANRPEGS